MMAVPSVDDVVTAFEGIEQAWENYRTTLRACIAEGSTEGISGRQAEISKRIGRTREALRQDAMSAEERAELRRTEAERRAAKAPAKRTRKAAK